MRRRGRRPDRRRPHRTGGRPRGHRTGTAFTDREAAALHFAARVAAPHVRYARRLAATESVALDPARGTALYAGAGHLPPAGTGGHPGPYTDGLVVRRGEDIDRSLARLTGLRLPACATAEEAVDAVVEGLDARHAEDDVAVLAARIRARGAPG
ncbi:hypothetical protein [Streptomyces katrae]|uniref:hypothetical protein n=1 Tax=Streptomyces katrae TaxID=68223 RepID=UPI0033079F9E